MTIYDLVSITLSVIAIVLAINAPERAAQELRRRQNPTRFK